MQLPCHFSGKEKSVSSVFHRFFRPKHSHDFTLQARFYTFITKNKTQSQPNDFSSGWKNIFFLRMAYRPVPQIRPKTSWRPFKIVPYRLVYSLIAPLLPSKKGSRHVRQIPLPAFMLAYLSSRNGVFTNVFIDRTFIQLIFLANEVI